MKLLRSRVEHRRAADIRADLGKVDVASLAAKVARIEQERRQLLLSGSDDQLHANERELAGARLQVERAETLIDELTRLASEADAREAEAGLNAEHAEATKAKATVDKALADAETVAAQVKAHLDEARAAAAIVAKWNHKAGPSPAGQPDRRIVSASPDVAMQRLIGVLR